MDFFNALPEEFKAICMSKCSLRKGKFSHSLKSTDYKFWTVTDTTGPKKSLCPHYIGLNGLQSQGDK